MVNSNFNNTLNKTFAFSHSFSKDCSLPSYHFCHCYAYIFIYPVCLNSAVSDLSHVLNYILFLMPQQAHISSCDQAKSLSMARWKEEFWTGLIMPEDPAVDLSIWESFSPRRFWETQMRRSSTVFKHMIAWCNLALCSLFSYRRPRVFTTSEFSILYKLVQRACKSCLLLAGRETLREENDKHRCTQTVRKEKRGRNNREQNI